MKDLSVSASFEKSLRDGYILLEWTARRLNVEEGAPQELQTWYTHIGLHYLRPWRPTFIHCSILPEPAGDDGYRAFECCEESTGARETWSLWDWLQHISQHLDYQWSVGVWHLSTRNRACVLRNRCFASKHCSETVTVWRGFANSSQHANDVNLSSVRPRSGSACCTCEGRRTNQIYSWRRRFCWILPLESKRTSLHVPTVHGTGLSVADAHAQFLQGDEEDKAGPWATWHLGS